LLVLKAPDIPSILFESGYLTNAQDAAYIQSPQGRQQIATGMRRAIEAHFARRQIRTAER
jgi:N-acetylmuramoyl-L-alanine amidase